MGIETYYPIRLSVINATAEQWETIKQMEVKGIVNLQPQETFEALGFFGGLTAKMTNIEEEFWRLFTEVARSNS